MDLFKSGGESTNAAGTNIIDEISPSAVQTFDSLGYTRLKAGKTASKSLVRERSYRERRDCRWYVSIVLVCNHASMRHPGTGWQCMLEKNGHSTISTNADICNLSYITQLLAFAFFLTVEDGFNGYDATTFSSTF